MANTVYPLKRQIVHVPLLGWYMYYGSCKINNTFYLRNMHIKNDNYLYYNNTGKWLPFQIKEMSSSDGCHFIDMNGKPWMFIHGSENNNITGAFAEETESVLWNITPDWFPYDEYITNIHARDCYHNNEDANNPIRWYFNFLAVTKSGKMYKTNFNNIMIVKDPDNPLNWLWPYGDKSSIKIKEWYSKLPENDRVIYKAGYGITCFIITAKGNLYVDGFRRLLSHNSKVNKNFFKVDLENVVDVTYDEWNLKCIYVLTADGVLHYTDSAYPPDFGYISDVTCLPSRVKRICLQGKKDHIILVECEDESYHIIYKNQLLYSFDKEVTEGKTLYHLPVHRFLAIDYNTGDYDCHYIKTLPYDEENDVYTDCVVYLYETTDKMPQMTNIRRPIEEPILPNVDLDNDYQTIDYTSSKYTNLKYLIRFALHQNISNDGLRNVVNYVTEYSTDNGVTWTAYNHSECQGSRTYTLADVENAAEELTEIAEVASDRIKTYLDTLIGDITLPGTNGNGELTKEISGLKSGKKFYLKTTFTKGATTNTDCVINYQTVYGTTLNYGTIYNQGTVTVTATGKEFSALTWSSDGKTIANNGPVNYKNHTSILTALAQDSAKGFFKKVQDLAAVQMFNVALPGSVSGAETAATKYTTAAGAGGGDGGNVYYYQVKYSQDDTTDTTNKIKIQVFYGNATNTVTTNTFYSDTYTILSTNYTTAIADIQNIAKGKVTDLKNFLNIPDVAGSLPATIERTYTKNNFAFKITIERAAKSASEKNIIITTPKVDGLIYGSAVTQTFHGTISSALTILETKANEFITAIENMCSAAPANTSSVYDKGNCHFTVGTSYSKTANNTNITVNTMCDGVVHKTSTVTIKTNANTIGTALTGSGGATPTATTDLNALKTVLSKCPVDTDVAYSKGNMNFTITKQFAKTAGNTTATYKVLVDGIEYQAATNVTLRPAVANLATDLATLGSNAGTYVTNAQTVLNGCPTDSSEDKTKNGFAYTLGIGYTKSAGTPKATSFATLDGTKYGSNTYDFKITTFAANKDTLVNNATTGKTTLANIINESPANTSETKTYNGFKYNVKTQYSKTKGQNVVTIKTLFDDQTYKSETKTVDPSSFVNDLNAITLQASNRKTELLNILDDSPANTDTTIYTIDGFKYYVGATFTKAADNKQVTVKIKLDGADKETYTANINGSTTASDIAAIASNANTKVTNLKNSLRGLPMVSVPWTVNGFNFNLKVKYVKDLDSGKITISSYIDDTKHLSDEVYDFVVDNIDTYSSKGDAKITALKNVVNNSPANTEKNVSKNNLSFKVGINYEKAKDSPTVYVYSMLDGNKLAGPHTINYDPNNIAAISTKGATDLTLLENTLNACPANYTTNYNVGNMGFTIGSAFSKTAGNSTVTIQTTLDGDNYGSAATQTFNINDIGALATKAQEKELALKAILDTCPKDSLEKFVYKKFAFNIEKLYSKTAGYHVVTSMVKLDGVQYDQYHQENFNVSNIGSIANSNNTIVENLKSRLVSVIPDDVHTTYSRNNFNFTIDAYYSKKEGSDVVDIEYNIDSADLSNDSDPISFSASSDMSHVNNG